MAMENKNVFREIIDDYEIARPGYTPELYNDIIEYSMIKNDGKILEIGSGPGQATEYFAKNQYNITGLEISEKQVQFLLDKYSE